MGKNILISVYEQFMNDYGTMEEKNYTKRITSEELEKTYKKYIGGYSFADCYINVRVIEQ